MKNCLYISIITSWILLWYRYEIFYPECWRPGVFWMKDFPIIWSFFCLNNKCEWYVAIGATWRHTQQPAITVATSVGDCSTQPRAYVTMSNYTVKKQSGSHVHYVANSSVRLVTLSSTSAPIQVCYILLYSLVSWWKLRIFCEKSCINFHYNCIYDCMISGLCLILKI